MSRYIITHKQFQDDTSKTRVMLMSLMMSAVSRCLLSDKFKEGWSQWCDHGATGKKTLATSVALRKVRFDSKSFWTNPRNLKNNKKIG